MVGLLRIPPGALVIVTLDFFERMAYYGAVFGFTSYCLVMLNFSTYLANTVINLVFAVAPLSAFVSAFAADGRFGRPKVLGFGGVTYVLGLILVACSSLPCFFSKDDSTGEGFPNGKPNAGALVLFILGAVVLSIGYGAVKVTTAPLMADCVCVAFAPDPPEEQEEEAAAEEDENGKKIGTPERTIASPHYPSSDHTTPRSSIAGDVSSPAAAAAAITGAPQRQSNKSRRRSALSEEEGLYADQEENDDNDDDEARILPRKTKKDKKSKKKKKPWWTTNEEREAVMTRTFGLYYWTFNVGATIGLTAFPIMRALNHQPKDFGEEGQVQTGFYYMFFAGAAASAIGFVTFGIFRKYFQHHPPPVIQLRELGLALLLGLRFCSLSPNVDSADAIGGHGSTSLIEEEGGVAGSTGTIAAASSSASSSTIEEIVDQDANKESPTTTEPEPESEQQLRQPSAREQLREAIKACRMFLVLPLYWLCVSQTATNMVIQALCMSTPSSTVLPPEILNNVSTIAILISLPLQNLFYSRVLKDAVPRSSTRMVIGFVFAVLAMLSCVIIQIELEKRAVISDDGSCKLKPEYKSEGNLSMLWMIVPFSLSGLASSFVDPTSLDSAYKLAPCSMKSLVMAVYLLASSASGWLGLLFVPLAVPKLFTVMYALMACLLAVASVIWCFWMWAINW